MADHVMADFEAFRSGAHKAAICELIAANPKMTIETLETYLEGDDVALEALKTMTFEEVLEHARAPRPTPLKTSRKPAQAKNGRKKRKVKTKAKTKAKSSKKSAPPRVVSSSDPNNVDGKIAAFLAGTSSATKREIIAGAKIPEGQFRPAIQRLLGAKTIKKQGHGRGASYRAA
jgi:hypothetical protein